MEKLLSKLEELTKAVLILDGMNEPAEEDARELMGLLENLKVKLAKMCKECDRTKFLLQKHEDLEKKLESTKMYVTFVQNNCPQEKVNANDRNGFQTLDTTQFESLRSQHTAISLNTLNSPFEQAPLRDEMKTPQIRNIEISVSYVSNEDLSKVPQYMKGRITLGNINDFLDVYNSTLNKKYNLLKKPKSFHKNKKDLDQYIEWKSQEIPEIKGHHFCTAKDFVTQEGKKLSTKENNIIIILRHVRRIREVRNKKVIYYVACF